MGSDVYNVEWGYSNGPKVLEYLSRIEPFTSSQLKMNGQKESEDRLFHDFNISWGNLLNKSG